VNEKMKLKIREVGGGFGVYKNKTFINAFKTKGEAVNWKKHRTSSKNYILSD
jgi:hypothetical protein